MAEQVLTEITQLRRSPLEHLADLMQAGSVGGGRAVRLRELPFLNMVGIRVRPGSAAAAALEAAAGTTLPAGCGDVTGSPEGTAVLWQGPDEFLLVGPEGSDAAGALTGALGTEPGSVVELSANRTTLELSGPAARRVLQKSCPADLHPRVFGPGSAVSTTLGPVPVLLWQTAEDSYRIFPRASFADYMARWLLDGMLEFSSPEVP